MHQTATERTVDLDPRETAEWMEALDQIVDQAGPDRVTFLLDKLTELLGRDGWYLVYGPRSDVRDEETSSWQCPNG